MKKYFFLLLLAFGAPLLTFAANDQVFIGAQIGVAGITIIMDGSADSLTVATSSFDITVSSSTVVTLVSADKKLLDNSLGTPTVCGTNESTLIIVRTAADPQVTVTITPGATCSSGGGGGGGGGSSSPPPAPPPPPPPPATTTVVAVPPVVSGKVSDPNGFGLAGILVEAILSGGSGYVSTTTSAGGYYAITLIAGTWDINAKPSLVSGYYNPDAPKSLTVNNNDAVSLNFILRQAEAAVSGNLIDEIGNAVSDASGFIVLQQMNASTNFGGQILNGAFSLRAPAGSYSMTAYLPDDSAYSAGPSKSVTLIAGQTVSVSIGVVRKNSFITGYLKNESGTVLTGFPARVFVTAKEGVWQETTVDLLTGKYTLKISTGSWYLGYSIDASSGYIVPSNQELIVSISAGATAVQDLVVKKAGSVISGQVIDPLGGGVSGVFVAANKISAAATDTQEIKDIIVGGEETDSSGFYKIFVPAGTYYVRTFLKPGFAYANAEEKYIFLDAGKTATLNFQLRVFELKIKGKVFLSTTTVNQAFVSGWSEKSGYQETQSLADGSFILNVNEGDVWRLSASKEISGVFYKSSEAPVTVGTTDAEQHLLLERVSELPPATANTVLADKPAVVSIPDGPTVFAPAGSISGGGSFTIIINPDIRTPAQAGIRVVGISYNLEAISATGSIIIDFADNVTISIPYRTSDLKDLGVFEDNLSMAFWDESVGTWKALENFLINKFEGIVTGTIGHFTRFAIVSAADTVPPDAPSSVIAKAVSGGKAELSWTTPARDFHSVKIYSSQKPGELGIAIASNYIKTMFIDTGLAEGVAYYYVVRSVDPAGNESKNTTQAKVVAIGTSEKILVGTPVKLPSGQATKLKILRYLMPGSSGNDVKALQELLIKEGVYPEGKITGFFGNLTKQAVIRFQEKYADEILKPAGLTKGTGGVGPATRKKMNELMGK